MISFTNLLLSLLQLRTITALVTRRDALRTSPTVHLDHATVVGVRNGSLESFLGIPYAEPPVGDLRLNLPQMIETYNGTLDATMYGHPCIQSGLDMLAGFLPEVLEGLEPLADVLSVNANVSESEDCLNLNIVRPANIPADAKLPVVVWMYGGGFVSGSNAISLYNGTGFVQRSIEMNEPVIYVALNYRLHVFGFLGGKEIKDAGVGNLGLQDGRAALHWVHKFIPAFGGDPSKVTIWGQSAGSISVFFNLFANGGNPEGLFRAGIMSSGTAVPTGDITELQGVYDAVVDQVGCTNATDTLACLRTVPADSLLNASNNVSSNDVIPFLPREDGVFVTMPPLQLRSRGKMANVPFITGDVKDEGTFFSFSILNLTTDEDFANLFPLWFPGSSPSDTSALLRLYPSDPAAGSPFDTGDANAFSPQFKRYAAMQGDWMFQAPRRSFLEAVSAKRTAYNYLSARGNYPGIGDFHGSDLLNAFGPGDMTNYFIHFVNHLNPNGASTRVHWPTYKPSTRSTLQFNEGKVPINVTVDNWRFSAMKEISSLSSRFPA
ncbi:carotenoid ester lipase precursor [Lentinus tigrinus ALCF2SS1-7]|uniref:Carboxylic ester hydrolase n=1 Tax=Lentinus tigrinus ALCF2SS1-6 TaxID=1328759 RepID=A0A5C2S6R6_9APHY|nr:carotenoid ester lipase precursor [Lentinus tigrinus ALCF2SS1-6]RPD68933.1 carotenoid ester lipase precursor [Lentinus tigrinus ALCF2SS1-7]